MTDKKLIDAKELGEMLDLPLQSVWRLAREKRVPHYRVGQLIKFDPREVLETLRVEEPGGYPALAPGAQFHHVVNRHNSSEELKFHGIILI